MPLVRLLPYSSAASRSAYPLTRWLGLVGLLLLLATVDPAGATPTPAHAAAADARLHITSPVNAAVVGDGDLVLVEGTAVDPVDGIVDDVEVAVDDDEAWTPVARDA